MNKDNAIEVRGLKKKFKIYMDKGHMLKERIIFANRNKHEDRWVLNGIDFDVKKGEAIGLIGKNGCGKSTTLKLLNRIIYPNEGTVEIDGRVSSLIELGAGFHEDMTGRENIYINASIFGLTKKQIDARLDDIIRFSELEEYIDNPVRTYSSGMYMRLAFSVAINVDADVLLIDEILAVGDVNFQEKCFQKLRDVKRNGTTIVIVSHSLSQIEKICDRVIWIEKGLIKEEGLPRVVNRHYLEKMEFNRLERAEQEYVMQKQEEERKKQEEEQKKKEEEKAKAAEREKKKRESEEKRQEEHRRKVEEERKRRNASCREICEQCGPDARRDGNGKVEFTNVTVMGAEGKLTTKFQTDSVMKVDIKYKKTAKERISGNISVGITRDDGVFCCGLATLLEDGEKISFNETGSLLLEIKHLPLLPGKYVMDFFCDGDENYDVLYNLIKIEVICECRHEGGLCRIDHIWKYDGNIIEQKFYKKLNK